MKRTLLIYIILLNLGAGKIQAQNSKDCDCFIQGIVQDQNTKQPIIGAVVLIKELNKGISTDSKGFYRISNLCQGKYTIIGRIVGYEEKSYTINLEHGAEQNIKLNETELHLANIDIKAQKIDNLTQNKSLLENTALDQTRGQSLGEALKQISGVTTLQTGSSIAKPVIHGMHSNRVLIMNNGVRQEGQQWGSEHAPEIDPFVAKKITVLKGAAGVRYGSDAIAGVIMLEPDALPDSTLIKGEVNSIYFSNGHQAVNSGILEGGIRKYSKDQIPYSFGMRLQGTYKRGGDISTPNYRLANTGIEEINYSLSANYKKRNFNSEVFYSQFNTQLAVFAGSHIGNVTDLIDAIKRGTPLAIYTPENFSYNIGRPYQDVQHNLLKLKNSLKITKGILSLTLGKQYDFRREIDILRGDKNLTQLFKLNTYTGELLFEHQPILKILTGSIGINSLYQENLTTGTLTAPRTSTVLIPNFQNFTSGLFLIERIVRKQWEIETGFRYDFRHLSVYRIPRGTQSVEHDIRNNQNFTGTAGINYRPNARWNFLTNISSAWRAATVNELYSDGVHHGAASFERGDENLQPEKALNTSFTANYIAKNIQFEAHIYNNFIQNFIFLSPTGRPALTIRGAFPEFIYTQTQALFQGFDLSSNFQFIKYFSFNSKLSYLKAQDITHQQPLIQIPANRLENTIRFEKKNTSVSLTHLYVAKQKRIPTKIIFTDIPSSEIVFTEYGGDFAPPPAAYMLWSATISQQITLSQQSRLNVSITINNALNTSYRDYLNRFRYFADEIGRNVALRVKYSF
ncbi:TonB-dependent receptor plug [Emticicia oligotrophica DSM 17448]|uniref:TonB-dependent receptor plug n=1 Tax=Emticicia oligotrophica (strain DSM 17448 / CIP 109782 / MTCC 6937 / GPTSA100-15) TaxID=929562 RepID=A0ABN4ANH3_EMTOG|nr:TonB-dependent receptor [Emticicia oligotrophica]AFK03913.1 TonB-dependent receptor plug [Emticicia oligotrophica DSM 17448]